MNNDYLKDDLEIPAEQKEKQNPVKSFINHLNSGQKISITVTLFLIFLFPALMLASTSQTRTTPHASTPTEIPRLPTITPLKISITPQPSSYWISFGTKGQPNIYNTAEKLLTFLSGNDLDALKIERWINGNWDGHVKGSSSNNFPIKPEEGYLIKVNKIPKSIGDKLPTISINSLNYEILPGLNFISIPTRLMQSFGPKSTAETLCKSINSQNGTVTEINLHPVSAKSDYWLPYKCGSLKDDFPVADGEGYFMKATASSTWTVSAK